MLLYGAAEQGRTSPLTPRLCVQRLVEAFLVQSLSVPLGKLLEPRAALLEELGELLYGL